MPTNVIKVPPPLQYLGSKHRNADQVISHFPPHNFYVEPFGGGASVLIQKSPVAHEVYNDIYDEVVNFFSILRDREDEFIRMLEFTPYSRTEARLSFEPSEDPLERARRFYTRLWQAYPGTKYSGFRVEIIPDKASTTTIFNRVDHLRLIAQRLKKVVIENDDAINVIKRYGRGEMTLIYCDPPYVSKTRKSSLTYNHELTDEQHEELAETLKSESVNAMVAISGYDCPLYQKLYGEWGCVKWQSQTASKKAKATECLWLSPNIKTIQPSLFNLHG